MKVAKAKQLMALWIGQVNLMGKWLGQHNLPYKKKDVVIIPEDDDDAGTAYEFTLDPEVLEMEARGESMPEVLKEGTVKVTFYNK